MLHEFNREMLLELGRRGTICMGVASMTWVKYVLMRHYTCVIMMMDYRDKKAYS